MNNKMKMAATAVTLLITALTVTWGCGEKKQSESAQAATADSVAERHG